MKNDLLLHVREPGFWLVAACTLPVTAYSALGGSFLGVEECAAGWLLLLSLCALAWRKLAYRSQQPLSAAPQRPGTIRRSCWVVLWAFVLLSVPVTRWPVRLSFLVARPALNAMADRLEKGEAVRVPYRAGLFTIRYANLRPDPYGVKPVPCLWIAEYGPPLLGEDRHAIGFLRAAPHVSWAWKPKGRFTWILVSHLTGDWFQTDED